MATIKEKKIGTLIGAGLGGFLAYDLAIKQKNENIFSNILKGVLYGMIGGYGITSLIGSPNNTVNYTHFNKGKAVYEGITYADRFDARMAEHRANGRVFTRVKKDNPKPRSEALKLEKERILKYKPINNIQHNTLNNVL